MERNVKEMKGDILAMQGKIDKEKEDLNLTIGRVVSEKMAGLPLSQNGYLLCPKAVTSKLKTDRGPGQLGPYHLQYL